MACFVGKTETTSPEKGATTSVSVGTIPTPLPNASVEKAASSTSLRGMTVPLIAAKTGFLVNSRSFCVVLLVVVSLGSSFSSDGIPRINEATAAPIKPTITAISIAIKFFVSFVLPK